MVACRPLASFPMVGFAARLLCQSGRTATALLALCLVTLLSASAVRGDVDVTNDARPALLWQSNQTNALYAWNNALAWNSPTAGTYAQLLMGGVVSTDWHIVATGDFDGDGQADLLWQNTTTNETQVWFLQGTTIQSQTRTLVAPANAPAPPWRIVAAADFNGDGYPDLLWHNPTTGDAYVWLYNPASAVTPFPPAFPSSVQVASGNGGTSSTFGYALVGATDFNQDGNPDLLWYNQSTGMMIVSYMTGTAPSSTKSPDSVNLTLFGATAGSSRLMGVTDVNQDGWADLLWQEASGDAYTWFLNGTTPQGSQKLIAAEPAEWNLVGLTGNNVNWGLQPLAPTMSNLTLTGASTQTVTIALTGAAPVGGARVTLAYTEGAANSTAVTGPASVNIQAGHTSATISINVSSVTAVTNETLTATYTRGAFTRSKSLNFTLTPPVVLSAVSVTPTSVQGGGQATGTVTLSGNAPSDTVVNLSASNGSVVSLPSSVTVAANTSSKTFTITTAPVGSSTGVTITASAPGSTNKTTTLTVTPPTLTGLTLVPTTLLGGANSSGTVTLSGIAPTGGLLVSLTSSNTAYATVPPVVRVPPGSNMASFLAATSPVASASSATITASLAGASIPVMLNLQTGTTQTQIAVADASVQGGSNAGTNYGGATSLRVANFGATNSSSGPAYLKFDLTSVTVAPQTATLKLTLNAGSTPSTGIAHVKIYGVSVTTWTESGITWNNAPGLNTGTLTGSGTLLTEADVPLSGGVASFDVSGYVGSNIGKLITLQAISETNDSLTLAVNSKEAGGGQPVLVLAGIRPKILSDVPAPAWALGTIPMDTDGAGDAGPSAADGVNLASGVYENNPGPDAVVRNPVGPAPTFSRSYRTLNAYNGYSSPGLPIGWTHNYDVTIKASNPNAWSTLTLTYPNGATETWTPTLNGSGVPTGAFTLPAGTPYLVTGMPSATTGLWASLTITFKDESRWLFNSYTNSWYVPTRLINIVGRYIDLTYDTNARLTDCKDDAAHTLLHLDYGNGGFLSLLTEYSDPTAPRKVSYATAVVNNTTVLGMVSQMYTGTAAARQDWKYDYAANPFNGTPFLSKVYAYDPSRDTGNYVSNSITYDNATGRVSLLTDANSKQHSYTYNGPTVVAVQQAGVTALQWSQIFDGLDKDTGDTDASGNSSGVVYGANNPYLPTQITNRNGQAVNIGYDNFGNATSTDALVNDQRLTVQTTYLYSSFALGRVDNVKAGGKTPTFYTYYLNNTRVNGVLQPNGMVATVSTPAPGVQEGGPTGSRVTTTYVYTALGNVASVMTPAPNSTAGATVTTTYNYTADTVNGITTTRAEALGEPLAVTDPLGHTTHFRYDGRGNVTAVIDANGNETDATYNFLDQCTSVTYPTTGTGGRASLFYVYTNADHTGPLLGTQLYNENGTLERQSFRGVGSEEETTGASGSTEAVGVDYDSLYRPKTLRDGNLNAHTSTYNANGLLQKFAFPLYNATNGRDGFAATNFDNNHNLTAFQDGNANAFSFVLANGSGGDDRLKTIHYPNVNGFGPYDATYTYDTYGRVIGVSYGVDSYAYTYDDNDLLLSETVNYSGLPGRTLSYAYNNDGSRASLGVNTNVALTYTYTYDNAGRLTNTQFSWNDGVSNTYQDNGWLLTQNTAVAHTTYAYNARGWLTLLDNTSPSAPLTHYSKFDSFAYDALGNVTSVRADIPSPVGMGGSAIPAVANNSILTYTYDSALAANQPRLTREDSPRNDAYNARYTYTHASDAADNLTTLRSAALPAYNADNQFASGATYDGQGNPLTYTWGGNPLALTWDAQDRLAAFGSLFTASYRPDGLRAWKQTGAASTRTYFLYDDGHVLAELDASGNLLSAYGWGAAGLAQRRASSLNVTYAYTFDPCGSLVQRHHLGVGTASYADYATCYDAFGAQRGSYNNAAAVASNQDAVGWGGQWGAYTDQQSAPFGSGSTPVVRFPLVLLGHREYDPGAGRFLNRDPVGMDGGFNLYAYCTNNPVNNSDPFGLINVFLLHSAEEIAAHGYSVPTAAAATQQVVTRVVEGQVARKLSTGLFLRGAVAVGGRVIGHFAGPVGIALTLYEVHHLTRAAADEFLANIAVSPEEVEADQPDYATMQHWRAARQKLLSPAPVQLHHIFPQTFKKWFAARGVMIDQWTVPLTVKTHLAGVHGKGGLGFRDGELPGKFNARWRAFIAANPNASAKEVYQFGGKLMDEYGLSGLHFVKYK